MDYGTDFMLINDDMVFTPDGDAVLVSGSACIAQDIDQQLKTTRGRLPWDKETGSSLLLMLNDAGSTAAQAIAELERVAIADPRVDPISVKAQEKSSGKFRLDFTPLSAIKPETLSYDLTKGTSNE
jgi:phage baseplate assembly protein W